MNNKLANKTISIVLGAIVLLTFLPVAHAVNSASPSVISNPSLNVFVTSAILQGSVNPNNSSTNTWFEYGTTQSLGFRTLPFPIGAGSAQINYSTGISNLSPSTTYYYRTAAQNGYGASYGVVLAFATKPTQVVQNITTIGTEDLSGIVNSLAQLSSALAKLNVLVGNLNSNRVTERANEKIEIASSNGSTLAKLAFTADKDALNPRDKVVLNIEIEPLTNLTKALLQVKLDSGLEFESTNASNFSKLENTFTYNLGNVPAGNAQVFKINARLDNNFNQDDAKDSALSSTATFSYSDANGSAKTPLFSSLDIKIGGAGFFALISNVLPSGGVVTILLIALLILLVAVAIKKLIS